MTDTFNDRGRLITTTNSANGITSNFTYNAIGQLIDDNSGSSGVILNWYDEAGHLHGEYNASGTLLQETVWLGDIPVATLRPNGSTVSIYYVHTNHLNTPLQVTRPSDGIQMWRQPFDPFNMLGQNTNPQGAGTFLYRLRLPGQVLQSPAGLQPNGFRDYDPFIGRYVESDPIGLAGGSFSTYAYVGSNPISDVDPYGLWSTQAHNAIIWEYGKQMGLPPDIIQAMEKGSYDADHGDGYQDAEHSFMHAMSSSKLNKAQACKMLNAFVADSVATAKALAAQGNDLEAARDLGFGLHAIMDSTSPAHAGFQKWHWWDFWKHGPFPTSKEDVNSLTPDLLQQTIDLMNAAIGGKALDCSCYAQ